jgi:hypothetical protein
MILARAFAQSVTVGLRMGTATVTLNTHFNPNLRYRLIPIAAFSLVFLFFPALASRMQ